MVLAIIGHDITNGDIQKRFQYSEKIISQCFHKGLNALILIHAYYI